MQSLPHRYTVSATGTTNGDLTLTSTNLEPLQSDAPEQFGGPGDKWSPETLLVAALADCFILSFRAIANASRLNWSSMSCDVEGVLDKIERVTLFTEFRISVKLVVPQATDQEKAQQLLEKAERYCLISNSMKATRRLLTTIETAA